MEPHLEALRDQAAEIERLRWRRRKDARQSKNLRDRLKRIRRDTIIEVKQALRDGSFHLAASYIDADPRFNCEENNETEAQTS